MNEATIKINSNALPVRDYNGQRVVTFKDIDTVHERKDGTAKRNFYTNREHFVEGVDFFRIQQYEIRTVGLESPNGGIVLTESGYLMLAKSFTDDFAWKVQRELVNNYFRVKAPEPNPEPPKFEQLTLETSEYHYFPKTYKGEPVITLNDFEHFTGFNHKGLGYHVKKQCEFGEDYLHLKGGDLFRYKNENPSVNKLSNDIILLKASAVRKLLQYLSLSVEIPMIGEKKAEEKTEDELVRTPKPLVVNTDECIVALNVLRYIKHTCKKFRKEEKERGDMKMVKRYDEEIAAIDTVMKSVGTFVAVGY